jgi:hypothetical protein
MSCDAPNLRLVIPGALRQYPCCALETSPATEPGRPELLQADTVNRFRTRTPRLTSRPFFESSLIELKSAFTRERHNPELLQVLLTELPHRTTARAAQLGAISCENTHKQGCFGPQLPARWSRS